MQDKGVVVQAVKDNFLILAKDKMYVCSASQKIKLKDTIVCGDKVIVNLENNYITEVLQRSNLIIRPKVANVDQVFITASFKKPDLAPLLVDKMILFYSFYNIKPILVFTKKDLKKGEEFNHILNEYKKAGYQVLESSWKHIDKEFFKNKIKSKISIFAGQSGVGKSTILNKLDPKLELKTNEISKTLNRGKHTTTKNTLYKIFDGLVCDTPGFSSIKQIAAHPIDLANQFLDFKKLMNECKFNNCIHLNEKDCKIKEQVGKSISQLRYDNYKKIIKNLKGEK